MIPIYEGPQPISSGITSIVVLGCYCIQFGQYHGKPFTWILENDFGWALHNYIKIYVSNPDIEDIIIINEPHVHLILAHITHTIFLTGVSFGSY